MWIDGDADRNPLRTALMKERDVTEDELAEWRRSDGEYAALLRRKRIQKTEGRSQMTTKPSRTPPPSQQPSEAEREVTDWAMSLTRPAVRAGLAEVRKVGREGEWMIGDPEARRKGAIATGLLPTRVHEGGQRQGLIVETPATRKREPQPVAKASRPRGLWTSLVYGPAARPDRPNWP